MINGGIDKDKIDELFEKEKQMIENIKKSAIQFANDLDQKQKTEEWTESVVEFFNDQENQKTETIPSKENFFNNNNDDSDDDSDEDKNNNQEPEEFNFNQLDNQEQEQPNNQEQEQSNNLEKQESKKIGVHKNEKVKLQKFLNKNNSENNQRQYEEWIKNNEIKINNNTEFIDYYLYYLNTKIRDKNIEKILNKYIEAGVINPIKKNKTEKSFMTKNINESSLSYIINEIAEKKVIKLKKFIKENEHKDLEETLNKILDALEIEFTIVDSKDDISNQEVVLYPENDFSASVSFPGEYNKEKINLFTDYIKRFNYNINEEPYKVGDRLLATTYNITDTNTNNKNNKNKSINDLNQDKIYSTLLDLIEEILTDFDLKFEISLNKNQFNEQINNNSKIEIYINNSNNEDTEEFFIKFPDNMDYDKVLDKFNEDGFNIELNPAYKGEVYILSRHASMNEEHRSSYEYYLNEINNLTEISGGGGGAGSGATFTPGTGMQYATKYSFKNKKKLKKYKSPPFIYDNPSIPNRKDSKTRDFKKLF